MHIRRVYATWFLATLTLLVAFVSGCGRETVNVPDTTPPYVISTTPAQGATGTALNPVISATFSKAMDATTITATTFTVTGPGGPIAGTVALSGNTATFTPSTPLAAQDVYYNATILAGVKDTNGNLMQAPYAWTFEAMNVLSVVATNPAPGAVGVPTSQIISATFQQDADSANAALNCATVTSGTFTVASASGGAVAGNVTCSGATATFAPLLPLAQNITYTATIAAGVQNAGGNGLAAPYVWTFTTGSQPTVVSTVPANGATGVPLDQSISAQFSAVMNCATFYAPAKTFTLAGPGATSVTGIVSCTGNGAIFTPANLLTANTLYTATITTGATDLQGQPLAANYVWSFRTGVATTAPTVISTNPANLATGVPINQKIAATFSEAMNPATINPTSFTLTAPGGVAVLGTVTYVASGSVATFAPTASLAPSTVYTATITTGAQDLATPPKSLAANYSWTFTTGVAPNTTKPTVLSTVPANLATGVPTNQAVSATFSTAMDPLTINSTTFTLTGPGATPVNGLVTYASVANTATFTPSAALAASTLFTATITTGAKDLSGNALAVNYVWTFTTAAAPNTTKPTITITSPINGATGVPINQAVSATFSEAMDPLTINPTTFTLSNSSGLAVDGTVTYDAVNFIATFTPLANLASSALYTADITTGATDLAGNTLGSGAVPNPWIFTTGTVVLPPPVALGAIATFGDFGGSAGMTNSGSSTVINGDIGTTAAPTLVVDFHDTAGCSYSETPVFTGGLVNGTIYTGALGAGPTLQCSPNEATAATAAIAAQAESDATTAYGQLVAFPNGIDVSNTATCPSCGGIGGGAGELGNRTLPPGIYKSAPGTYAISQGDLTLDAQGNPNAFWVFQMAASLTVGSATPALPRNVLLINGALPKNVFWQVYSHATINGPGGGTMVGTIISQAGVSVSTAGVAAISTIDGRAISLNASVTIVNTVINVPAP